MALGKRLCFKCLNERHFKDRCPKETLKCQVQGCVENHNTLSHADPIEQVERTSATTLASMAHSVSADSMMNVLRSALRMPEETNSKRKRDKFHES